jgi:hypothetical protein
VINIALWIVGVIAALLLIDRLGVWAERKGWIYWRERGRSSAMSGVFSGFDVVANPGAEYVTQAKETKKQEECDSGPEPRK